MIECVVTGDLEENTYILYNNGEECILIDPGADSYKIESKLKEIGKIPKYVLLTHGHFDHIGSAKHFQNLGAKVYVHEYDSEKLEYDRVAVMFGYTVEWLKADELLHDGDVLNILGFSISVIHTPGHTKGGVCYVVDDEKCIFSGDTIFFRSYGRFDFPDGSKTDLMHSISKIFSLEGRDDFIIYPGHGISTTLEDERKNNAINALF